MERRLGASLKERSVQRRPGCAEYVVLRELAVRPLRLSWSGVAGPSSQAYGEA
jgi:hypothetical protein